MPTNYHDETMDSLLKNIPANLQEELFETLCSGNGVRIERIVSKGHSSPDDFWYDQEQNEFVLVVQGSAGLRIDGEAEVLVLNVGDYVTIGAHVRHRVEWTDESCETIWLAVHY